MKRISSYPKKNPVLRYLGVLMFITCLPLLWAEDVNLTYTNKWITNIVPGVVAEQPAGCEISVTIATNPNSPPGTYEIAFPYNLVVHGVFALTVGSGGNITWDSYAENDDSNSNKRVFPFYYGATQVPLAGLEDSRHLYLHEGGVGFIPQLKILNFKTTHKYNNYFYPPDPPQTWDRVWFSKSPDGRSDFNDSNIIKKSVTFLIDGEDAAGASGKKGKGRGRGRGPGNGPKPPPPKPPPCPGMAVPSYFLRLAALSIQDTPVGYQPPRGEGVYFTLDYNQLAGDHDPYADQHSNVGPNWTFDWLSYISGDPANGDGETVRYAQGGGHERYNEYQPVGVDLKDGAFSPEFHSGAILRRKNNPDRYERTLPDGSVEIYGKIIDNPNRPFPLGPNGYTTAIQIIASRQYYLTKKIDPQGNVTELVYAPGSTKAKLTEIKDAQGYSTRLFYTHTDPLKITKVTDPYGRSATLTYNNNSQLASITDVIGIKSAFAYGVDNFIQSLTTPYGVTTFETEKGAGYRVLQIIDPLGDKQRVEYRDDIATTLVPATEAAVPSATGLVINNSNLNKYNSFYWDKKAMKHAELEGNTLTSPEFYAKAQITHWAWGDGHVMNVASSTKEPFHNRIWYNFQDQADPNELDVAKQALVSKVANLLPGNVTQVFQQEYNEIGNLLKSIDPLGRETTYVYDPNNIDVLTIKQKNGAALDVLAVATYNSLHQPLTMTDPAGQTTTNTYNPQGQILTVTNAKSEVTTFAYDTAGYLTSVDGPLAGTSDTTTFTYDIIDGKKLGRIKTVTDSESYVITTDYDAFDRPVKVTYPDNTYEQTIYYLLEAQRTRDRKGQWTKSTYNAVRQLVQTSDPLGRVTQYEWCKCGQLQKLTDGEGKQTNWQYDVVGQLLQKKFADNTVINYTYDVAGRLATRTDALNQITTYAYNVDNTIGAITYTNPVRPTPNVSASYDTIYRRVTQMIDGSGTTLYTYKPMGSLGAGNIATIDGPLANDTITMTYDQLGRVTDNALNGVSQTVGFDALGRVTSVVNPLGTFGYTYINATGRLDFTTYPNGLKADYAYANNAGDQRLLEIKNLNSSATVISKFNYTYEPDGQIATWSQQVGAGTPKVFALGYDTANQLKSYRLTSGTATPQKYNFSYDKAGNRLTEQADALTKTATVNTVNQITNLNAGGKTRVSGVLTEPATVTVNAQSAAVDAGNRYEAYVNLPVGTNTVAIVAQDFNNNTTAKNYRIVTSTATARTLTYDAVGNVTNDGAGKTYQWDAENRLIKITIGANITEFVYNGQGQRVKEKLNGTITKQWVWCGGAQPCEERNASNVVTKRFYAQGVQVPGASSPSNKLFYLRDHLGSVRELVDNNQVVRGRWDYDPHGRRSANLITTNALSADMAYTGHYYHASSGLYLTWYRAYDADLGRWLSRDPIAERGGINLYAYVSGNSINHSDPYGLEEGSFWSQLKNWNNYRANITLSGGSLLGGNVTMSIPLNLNIVNTNISWAIGLGNGGGGSISFGPEVPLPGGQVSNWGWTAAWAGGANKGNPFPAGGALSGFWASCPNGPNFDSFKGFMSGIKPLDQYPESLSGGYGWGLGNGYSIGYGWSGKLSDIIIKIIGWFQ